MNDNDLTVAPPKAPWFPISLKYGIIFGLISGLVSVVIFLTENFGNFWIGLILGSIIYIAGIILTHREYKNGNGGYMSYGQGFLSGLIMAGFVGLISGIISFLYIQFVGPTVLEKMTEVQIEFMEKMNIPEEQMEKTIAELEEKNTAFAQLTGGITGGLFIGFLFSLIVSAFTKRTRPEFE